MRTTVEQMLVQTVLLTASAVAATQVVATRSRVFDLVEHLIRDA
jgi:hypothetical protein